MYTKYHEFIYLPGVKAIYCSIPKVACTNWKALFRRVSGAPDWSDGPLAHDRDRSGLCYLDSLPEAHAKALLADSGIFRFVFVRNPFDRLLSAYLNKFVVCKKWGGDWPVWREHVIRAREKSGCPNDDGERDFTFAEFVQYLEDLEDGEMNEHWAPQAALSCIDEVRFDFVGHFESLSADAENVLKRLNIELPFPSPQDVKFSPTGAREKLAEYYDDMLLARVRRRYHKDFTAFGYPTED